MQKIDFYTNPMSRGRIARWMLEEIGAPYQEHVLGYGPGMQSADYLAINPMGKVPAIRHHGRIVTECAAICVYLADVFPEQDLGPAPEEKADYYRWIFFAAGPVEQAVTSKSMGWSAESREKEGMLGFGSFDRAMSTLEKAVTAHPFIAGDRFTAADVYVGSQILWGLQFGTMPKLAAFEEYAEKLRAREAYQKATGMDDALMAEMQAANS